MDYFIANLKELLGLKELTLIKVPKMKQKFSALCNNLARLNRINLKKLDVRDNDLSDYAPI